MTVAGGLAPSQFRALGLTVGAVYVLYALRGVAVQSQLRPEIAWGPLLVSALAWVPGALAVPALIANRVQLGRQALALAVLAYPVAVLVWPAVAIRDDQARLDFWIHGIPGLAAVAAILVGSQVLAWLSLVGNCVLVEIVMQAVGIVEGWETTMVRLTFSLAFSGFFFVLVLSMLRDIERGNRVLLRSSRDQTEAAVMQARDEEIERLDRLTHDFVLSLLSSAAEGVPTDKLRVQADTVRRRLGQSGPAQDEADTIGKMVNRIVRRCERYGIPVDVRTVRAAAHIPRHKAVELEAAVEEAVRNTVRHATGGSRVVLAAERGVTIQICDDGPGFDPTAVRERLGVSQSILHRVNSLLGGHAEVDSAPGRGTVVTIAWSLE